MEFDDVFQYIGDFGVYQMILFILLGLTSFLPGMQNMGMTIIGAGMDHWCEVPSLQNFSFAQQKYIAIPWEDSTEEEYSQCEEFSLDYDNYTDEEYHVWERVDSDWPSSECDSWVYDRSEFVETAVSKYNLVCTKSYMVSLSSTIYLIGMLTGSLSSGFLSDRFGRKKIMVIFSIFSLITAVSAAYAPDYWSFTIIRFLISFCLHVVFLCAFVILMEIIAPTHRTVLGCFFHMFFSIGYVILPVIGYYARDFKYVQLCMAAPVLVTLSYIFLIPESPRWLISKGKYDEAKTIVEDIARINNIDIPDTIDFQPVISTDVKPGKMVEKKDEVSTTTTTEVEKGTIVDILKRPKLRNELLIIYLGWFTNSLLYYGLGLNAGALPGSIFLNVFIGGAIEFPAVCVTVWAMFYLGRRKTMAWGFVIAAVANFLCMFVLDNEDLDWLLITFSMFGKACIKLTFVTIYTYTAELFPTPVRHIAVGSSSMMSRFGGIIAPFMGEPLMEVWGPLPSLIFGVTTLITGVLSFFLPETLNKPMPDTFEEAEALGRKETMSSEEDGDIKDMKLDSKPIEGHLNMGYGSTSEQDVFTSL